MKLLVSALGLLTLAFLTVSCSASPPRSSAGFYSQPYDANWYRNFEERERVKGDYSRYGG